MTPSFPDRPTTSVSELQRDLVALVRELGSFCLAKTIRDVTVGTTETRLEHGLKGPPGAFFTQLLSPGGPVSRSRPSDLRFIYLVSASGTVTVDVAVVP